MKEIHAIFAGILGSLTGFASQHILKGHSNTIILNIALNIIAVLIFLFITVSQMKCFTKALSILPVGYATAVSFLANISLSVS